MRPQQSSQLLGARRRAAKAQAAHLQALLTRPAQLQRLPIANIVQLKHIVLPCHPHLSSPLCRV